MTRLKVSPASAISSRKPTGNVLLPRAAALVAAMMCVTVAASEGAEAGSTPSAEATIGFAGTSGTGRAVLAGAQRTQYAQQTTPLIMPNPQPNAAATTEWSPPQGNTGMELLPPPSDPPIAQNGAGGLTHPGAARQPEFTLNATSVAAQIMTYHYGAKVPPGLISLQHDDGTIYGPWQAAGAVGQGGVQNAYWWAQPNVVLKPGHYVVLDSDPTTWSVEASTQGAGIFVIWGHPN